MVSRAVDKYVASLALMRTLVSGRRPRAVHSANSLAQRTATDRRQWLFHVFMHARCQREERIKNPRFRVLTFALFLAYATAAHARTTMAAWLTRSADNSRSGWNPHETLLSLRSVRTEGIVRTTIIAVVGDARGMEAHPSSCRTSRRRAASVTSWCFPPWQMSCEVSTRTTAPESGRWSSEHRLHRP
jgi:hypothetical protein